LACFVGDIKQISVEAAAQKVNGLALRVFYHRACSIM